MTYAEKIGAEDRLLDPGRTAVELERQVRALHPHIGARLALADGTLLGVSRAALGEEARGSPLGGWRQAPDTCCTGQATGRWSCWRSSLPAGAPMDAGAYLRGHAL